MYINLSQFDRALKNIFALYFVNTIIFFLLLLLVFDARESFSYGLVV